MSKPLSARGDVLRPAERRVEDRELDILGEPGPVGHLEGHVLIVVEDGAAMDNLG